MNYQEILEIKLKKIENKNCWAVLAGEPHASTIFIHVGNKMKRKYVVDNKKLPYELDIYEGEYCIGVYCDWRLQDESTILTGCCEPNYADGPLVKGVGTLVGKKITQIKIDDYFGDIDIIFENMVFKIFCNFTNNYDPKYCFQDERNWDIYSCNFQLTVGVERGGKIVFD